MPADASVLEVANPANPALSCDPAADVGWGFSRRPRWILSHLFVLGLLALFIGAGFWQLGRLSERRATNATIEERALAEPVTITDAVTVGVALVASDDRLAGGRTAEALTAPTTSADDPVGVALDYRAVADVGRWVEGEFVRVANRSQDGRAGDWLIGVFETSDGRLLLVNRGFIGRDDLSPPVVGEQVRGWLRRSQIRAGFFGADVGDGDRVPRLDVAAIGSRLELADQARLAPVWLQLDEAVNETLSPVPLPPISEGSHLSYAIQWFTFTVMGAVAYGLVLRRQARRG